MTSIRLFEERDWPETWALLEPVFRAGETYSIAVDITEEDTRRLWVEAPAATFVAVADDDSILGTYYLKANQGGPGSHVCNCGYVVARAARGSGVATAMCEHSQTEAMRRGFRAMQFNCVVSANSGAVRLWQSLGFAIVGTLPEAFRHPQLGYVDAYVMFKTLAG